MTTPSSGNRWRPNIYTAVPLGMAVLPGGQHMGKAMVFIDGNNLYYSLKSDTGNTKLDFLKFGQKLAQPDDELPSIGV